MSELRLLIADDHRMFRQGLRELIERKTSFVIVGEAENGREAIAQAHTLRPDLLLLDIQMPDMDGLAAARELAVRQPQLKIIMLTMYRQDQHMLEALRIGVRAFLLKDADAEELVTVIHKVQRGEPAIDPALIRRMAESQQPQQLSERDQEILVLLSAGHDNRTIANQLCLAEKTVANRLSDIFQKLGVANRTQAAMVAVQRGLVSER